MSKPWKIEDGLALVRALQKDAKSYGYHITLGGSVLNKGESDNDIDLYFLPLAEYGESAELLTWLKSLWGEPRRPQKKYDSSTFSTGMQVIASRVDGQVIFQRVPIPPPIPQDVLTSDVDAVFNQEPVPVPKAKKDKYPYKHALTFQRVGNDLVDVFIL